MKAASTLDYTFAGLIRRLPIDHSFAGPNCYMAHENQFQIVAVHSAGSFVKIKSVLSSFELLQDIPQECCYRSLCAALIMKHGY